MPRAARSNRRTHPSFESGHSTGNNRWMVSYADFLTLLFAFFVVMYAVSSVNEGKYRVLSSTLVEAFRNENLQVVDAEEAGAAIADGAQRLGPGVLDGGVGVLEEGAQVVAELEAAGLPDKMLELRALPDAEPLEDGQSAATFVESRLAPLVDQSEASVREGEDWVEIELDSQVLFRPGSAELSPQAQQPLEVVLTAISNMQNGLPVRVEGHTDNLPIATPRYPSNWELSASRASSVVRALIDAGVEPARLAAIGYGDARPKASNDTDAGRRSNRRVVIALAARENVGTFTSTTPLVIEDGAAGADTELEAQGTAADPLELRLERVTRLPGLEGIP